MKMLNDDDHHHKAGLDFSVGRYFRRNYLVGDFALVLRAKPYV